MRVDKTNGVFGRAGQSTHLEKCIVEKNAGAFNKNHWMEGAAVTQIVLIVKLLNAAAALWSSMSTSVSLYMTHQ